MTIAACYLSTEGVVLGADSTTSWLVDGSSGYHYFNHNQKVFELGENATIGIVTWGLAGLGTKSYRTLIAAFSDDLQSRPPQGMSEVADRWSASFWREYQAELQLLIQRCKDLNAKPAYDPATPNSSARNEAEEKEFKILRNNMVTGFCLAGYWLPDRTPAAFEFFFDPLASQPKLTSLPMMDYRFWGAYNLMKRLIWGADDALKADILSSGKWGGTPSELDDLVQRHFLGHGILPVRDAVDFVHTCIYSTIKALKFSSLPQICGGPIELAVITSDRRFRWVRHKSWDSAILET